VGDAYTLWVVLAAPLGNQTYHSIMSLEAPTRPLPCVMNDGVKWIVYHR